jgi:hypothetical protein
MHPPLRGLARSGRSDPISDPDLAVLENVGAESAPVNKLSQHWPVGVTLYHRAGLAQPHAAAADRPDAELVSDQMIEVDASGDEVPPVLIRRQRRRKRLAYFGFDDRQRATRKA